MSASATEDLVSQWYERKHGHVFNAAIAHEFLEIIGVTDPEKLSEIEDGRPVPEWFKQELLLYNIKVGGINS